jgi:hypothetical protein
MWIPLLPYSCCMPCPSHPPWLHHYNNVWRVVQVTKFLIMQFPRVSRHFISLRPRYSPQHPALSLCSSLNVRNQVSHPYRTTSIIIVLYILIFTFFKSVGRAKGYGLGGPGPISGIARFFSSAQCADRLWGPPSVLSSGYWGLFLPRGQAAGSWRWSLTSI